MSKTIKTNPSDLHMIDVSKILSKRCIEYAGMIGFSIGALKRIKSLSTDEAIKLECDYAIKHLETEFEKA